jgi:hypothetical protein
VGLFLPATSEWFDSLRGRRIDATGKGGSVRVNSLDSPRAKQFWRPHRLSLLTACGERLEKCLEDARLAQSPEPLPNAVPVAELGGKRPPCYVVDHEVVEC